MSIDAQKRELLETAARMSVGLLAKGEYEVLEAMTRRIHLSAGELRFGAESLGHPLIRPPDSEWSRVIYRRSGQGEPEAYDVTIPLWTAQGRSQRGIQLHLSFTSSLTLKVEIRGFVPIEPQASDSDPLPIKERSHESRGHEMDSDPASGHASSMRSPVPERWRPLLTFLVHRLVTKDYAGLAADGLVSYTSEPTDTSIGRWIEEYPATLVDLPPEAWAYSDHGPQVDEPSTWWVIVDLWTAEEGRSDLSMEAIVWEEGAKVAAQIQNVHVM